MGLHWRPEGMRTTSREADSWTEMSGQEVCEGTLFGRKQEWAKGEAILCHLHKSCRQAAEHCASGLTLESCVGKRGSEGSGPSVPNTDQSLDADGPWEVGRDLRQGKLSSAEGNFQKELPAEEKLLHS